MGGGRRAATAGTWTQTVAPGSFGSPQDSFADDVPLDLGSAAPDGLGPAEEEARLQGRHGVVGPASTP